MKYCKKCKNVMEDDMIFCSECGTRYAMFDSRVLFADDCPVVLIEKAITISDGKTDTYVIFSSVSEKTINAVSVTLKCSDSFGDPVSDTNVKYNDLMVNESEFFGDEKVIVPTDSDTRRFDVVINKVIFSDGTMWQNDNNAILMPSDNYQHLRDICYAQFQEDAEVEKWRKIWDELNQWYKDYYQNIIENFMQKREACDRLYRIKKLRGLRDTYFGAGLNDETICSLPEIKNIDEQFDILIAERNRILNENPDFIVPDGVEAIPQWMFSTEIPVELVDGSNKKYFSVIVKNADLTSVTLPN